MPATPAPITVVAIPATAPPSVVLAPTVPVSWRGDDTRMIAYLGNWQSRPTADQLAQSTHIVVAFTVSYRW